MHGQEDPSLFSASVAMDKTNFRDDFGLQEPHHKDNVDQGASQEYDASQEEIGPDTIVDMFLEGTAPLYQDVQQEWHNAYTAQAAIINTPAKPGSLRKAIGASQASSPADLRSVKKLLQDDQHIAILSAAHYENLSEYDNRIRAQLKSYDISDEDTRGAALEELIQANLAVRIPEDIGDTARTYFQHLNDLRAATWRACLKEENCTHHIESFLEDAEPEMQEAFIRKVEAMMREPDEATAPFLSALAIYSKQHPRDNLLAEAVEALYRDPAKNTESYMRHLLDPSGRTQLQLRFKTATQITKLLVTAEKGTDDWYTEIIQQITQNPEHIPSWFPENLDWFTTESRHNRVRDLKASLEAFYDDTRACRLRLTPAYVLKLRSEKPKDL